MTTKSASSFHAELEALAPADLRWHFPLARLTTMAVGGPVLAAITVDTTAQLAAVLAVCARHDLPWKILGNGSNIVAGDDGWPGLVVRLGADFKTISRDGGELRAGSGVLLATLFSWCRRHSLAGVEFLAGIPGTVGGAVAMNAGAWGREIADILHSVTILDGEGEIREIRACELSFRYRHWQRAAGTVLLSATFALTLGDREEISRTARAMLYKRRTRQPQKVASAGSFFKNPEGHAAGQLIEAAGLKGLRCGGAMISDIHANFIVNTGNARACDIQALMHKVQDEVESRFGVRLEPEVHFLDHEKNAGRAVFP